MNRPLYILLVGLPASGKSTLASRIYDQWKYPKPIVLYTDDYIEAVAAGKCNTYSAEFQSNIKAAEAYVAELRAGSLRAGADIIHDQTNLTVKSRSKKLAGIPRSYLKLCLVVGASESARQARLLNRPGKVIPPDVDIQMRASWQDTTLSEGFDEILFDWNYERYLFPHFSTILENA